MRITRQRARPLPCAVWRKLSLITGALLFDARQARQVIYPFWANFLDVHACKTWSRTVPSCQFLHGANDYCAHAISRIFQNLIRCLPKLPIFQAKRQKLERESARTRERDITPGSRSIRPVSLEEAKLLAVTSSRISDWQI
jgi:hypothetical protein